MAAVALLVHLSVGAPGLLLLFEPVFRRLEGLRATALWVALTVSWLVLATSIVGRWTGSLDAGLGGAAFLDVLLLGGAHKLRKSWPQFRFVAPTRQDGVVWGAAVALTFLLGVVSFRYEMHDEFALFGHQSMVAQLRQDFYPPFFPPFPESEARYHYGFDLIAGAMARAFGFSNDLAIDLSSVLLFFFLPLVSAALIQDLTGRKGGAEGVIFPALGTGLAFLLLALKPGRHIRCLIQYHHPSCGIDLYPPTLSNLYQHPISLGLPLALAALLVLPRILRGRRLQPLVLGAGILIMAALSLGQIVYFALLQCAFLALAVLRIPAGLRSRRLWALSRAMLVVGASTALGLMMGGMFASNEALAAGTLRLRMVFGHPNDLTLALLGEHLLMNQGVHVLLLLSPLALRGRAFVARGALPMIWLFYLGGLIPPHFWEYTRSWDIIKFPSASAALGSVGFAAVLILRVRKPLLRWPLILAGSGGGFLLLYWLIFPPPPDLRFYHPSDSRVDPVIEKTIRALHQHGYRREEKILALPNVASQLAWYGGMSVVGQDGDLWTMGIDPERWNRDRGLTQAAYRSLSGPVLSQLGIRWVVVSDEERPRIGSEARRRLDEGDGLQLILEVAGETPQRHRRVWRVVDEHP